MKRVLIVIIGSLTCLLSHAQKSIDFFDFYKSFSWDWSIDDVRAKYGTNVSGVIDSLVISNVMLGDYKGNVTIALETNSYVSHIYNYDVPVERFEEFSAILIDEIGEPANEVENGNNHIIMWAGDNNILMFSKSPEICSLVCMSQSSLDNLYRLSEELYNAEHLKFKGIPIDGTPQEFVKELVTKGFHDPFEHNGVWIVEGPFAGYNNTRVYVSSTNNLVFAVSAYIDFSDNWPPVKAAYERLKSSLASKYGVKPQVEEYFPSDLSEGSGLEYLAFIDNRASYLSVFNVPHGIIKLTITRLKEADGFEILLAYFDTANGLSCYDNLEDDL